VDKTIYKADGAFLDQQKDLDLLGHGGLLYTKLAMIYLYITVSENKDRKTIRINWTKNSD
jgi:hypothetical protein